ADSCQDAILGHMAALHLGARVSSSGPNVLQVQCWLLPFQALRGLRIVMVPSCLLSTLDIARSATQREALATRFPATLISGNRRNPPRSSTELIRIRRHAPGSGWHPS